MRIVVGAVVAGVLLLGGIAGAAFVPRWWAHRIADQVGGSIAQGIVVGLVYGVLFSALPLLVLWLGFRKRRSWKLWTAFVVVAMLLALPNLLTLGIVVGGGSGAHAGERTLDVDAPGYRGAVLVGVLLVLALAALVGYQLVTGKRLRRRVKTLDRELRTREELERATLAEREQEQASLGPAEERPTDGAPLPPAPAP
jgi:MFS family permease